MNEFKFIGTITHIAPIEKGTTKDNKEWQKLSFTVKEEKADYPQSCTFTMMKADKIESFSKYNKLGDAVEVSFNLTSREYNGKYYNDVQAWHVFGAKGEGKADPKAEAKMQNQEEQMSDLPF